MRVPEEVRRCVVFLCLPTTSIDGQAGFSFVGTAFFVGLPSRKKEGVSYIYLVTAKHVAERLAGKPFLIRVNNTRGSSEFIRGEGITWFTHPTDDLVDAAVIPYAPPRDLVDFKFVTLGTFLSDEIMQGKQIGIGDEVFITGLFVHASGSQRNLPIIRMGNIAMIPNEPIPTDLGNIDAYLIEARSIGGLSGSPAFVRATSPVGLGDVFLLGLMHGHWDIPPEEKNDFLLRGDFFGSVNMGIAIVIPAKKILEVLNHPSLVKQREELDEK